MDESNETKLTYIKEWMETMKAEIETNVGLPVIAYGTDSVQRFCKVSPITMDWLHSKLEGSISVLDRIIDG